MGTTNVKHRLKKSNIKTNYSAFRVRIINRCVVCDSGFAYLFLAKHTSLQPPTSLCNNSIKRPKRMKNAAKRNSKHEAVIIPSGAPRAQTQAPAFICILRCLGCQAILLKRLNNINYNDLRYLWHCCRDQPRRSFPRRNGKLKTHLSYEYNDA